MDPAEDRRMAAHRPRCRNVVESEAQIAATNPLPGSKARPRTALH